MANITARISSSTSAGPQKVSVTIPSTGAIQNSSLQLKLLGDVDTTTEGLIDGSLLQYRSSDQKFVTRTNIITTTGNLTLNGGEY